MTPNNLRDKMEELKRFIQDAEAAVRSGTMVDLAGLDNQVALLCQKAVSLPPAQAYELQPLMADVIGELERLGMALKDFRDGLKS